MEIQRYHTDEYDGLKKHADGYYCCWWEVAPIIAERDELKRLGTKLCTEATPWADMPESVNCATNRAALRHAIEQFLQIGYDGIAESRDEKCLCHHGWRHCPVHQENSNG